MQPTVISDNQEMISGIRSETKKSGITRSRYFRYLLIAIKIAAGVGLLILAVRGIQFDNLVQGLRSVDPSWLMLTILCTIIGLGLKLWRWNILLNNYHLPTSFIKLFSAYFVGQAVNIVLPLRGGEVVRIGYLAKDKKTLPGVTSTIVMEKYLDILALTVSCIFVSLYISVDTLLNLSRFLFPLAIIATAISIFVIFLFPRFWLVIKEKLPLSKELLTVLDNWIQSSQWLKNPLEVLPSVLFTALIWAVMWFTNLLLFKALGLPVSSVAGGLVLVLVYIGLLPALMPGNIGPFYFFASIALLPFGILRDQAVVFAVLLHAIVTLPPLLCGTAGLVIHSQRTTSA